MTSLSVADVLDRAADLIEPEGAWSQGDIAENVEGFLVNPLNPDAVCWCAMGALGRAANGNEATIVAARHALRRAVGCPWIADWNDDPDRTQAEVVSKLREAATLSRSSENRNG